MALEITLRYQLQVLFGFENDRLPELQKALEDVRSPEVEQMVRDLLKRAMSLMTTIEQERSSANFALKRADVLEWDSRERSAGMLLQKLQLKKEIANLLGISSWQRSYPVGSTSIGIRHVL